ncbi:adaptor protein MecA [Lapidilactobacillus luobeiensis]|uniref:adaptor protein MecA n=1 Tax=Lapidilactobacillus luobeiensis TaxID=2950371 RepID=UPI0021C37611|nr:adaptor protein MecA [Lapidilactobacillus luobeiensis]
MEMERIDENTIRVILGREDLEERGVKILDLLANHQQIEKFFYSILEEVDEDHMFADNDAVTFQVMPNKGGLELLISKLDEDELADRAQLESALQKRRINSKQHQNKGQLAALQKKLQSSDEDDEDELSRYLEDGDVDYQQLVLRLPDFEALIQLADALRIESGISNLYRYQDQYYLELVFFVDDMHDISVEDALAIANEYGERTTVTAEVLSEYGKKIMDQVALQTTRHYFLAQH